MAMALSASGPCMRPGSLMGDTDPALITEAILGLDQWLDSMRRPAGYAGAVVHWWCDCLDYIGPGLDWRYEGIIAGYLNLWSATGEAAWLAKAIRAGDDLVAGQLPSGNYRNSCFELNPNTGGTPHEAACDLALLHLASTLRDAGKPDWEVYYRAARRNLQGYYVGHLWRPEERFFSDSLSGCAFVPNKAATLVEALFALSRLTCDAEWTECYGLPTLHRLLDYQIHGGYLNGAIYQNSIDGRKVAGFLPYYIVRCIPALMEGFAWSQDDRFAQAAQLAAEFVLRWRYADGSFPQAVYPGNRVLRFPQWVAGAGDFLRVLALTGSLGVRFNSGPTLSWMLAGRRSDGGIKTAVGFGRTLPAMREDDSRDRLAVCGWNDKAFRYLTSLVESCVRVDAKPGGQSK